MIGWLRSLFAPARRKATVPAERFNELRARYATIKAKYDAAQTTDENKRHWANADGLSAAAANAPGVRRILRNRSRYEFDNSGYWSGIIRTRADDLVGTGPTLQILTDDDAVAEQVEQAFAGWAAACGLAEKLHTMDQAENRDGETFAVLTTNARLDNPVQLDLVPVEADRITYPAEGDQPAPEVLGGIILDGIEYDPDHNPVRYAVLQESPGDRLLFFGYQIAVDWYPARYVLHSFRVDRPGQLRGVPELTSSLPLAAYLRRWTLATLSAAETAALFAAMLETQAPPDGETDEPVPFETLEIERGMMTALPTGAKLNQLKAEQPTTTYPDFKREILTECGRPVQMPSNVVSGDSSRHNVSSAKLDHYGYRNALRVRREFRSRTLLERLFRAWAEEAVLVPGLLPAGVDVLALRRAWYWPGWASMDKDDAKNDTERLNNSTATLSEILAEWGVDWKAYLRQRGRELKYAAEQGVPPPPRQAAGNPFGGGDGAPVGGEGKPGLNGVHRNGVGAH
jgi:capsid protein